MELDSTTPQVVLHRLAEVRRAKGMPRRVLAQRLGISVQELRLKEESADLSISTLCQWASVLNVPITELVVEPDECLAPTRLRPVAGGPADEGGGQASRPGEAPQHPAAGTNLCRAVGRDSSRPGADCPKEPSSRPGVPIGSRRPPACRLVGAHLHATPRTGELVRFVGRNSCGPCLAPIRPTEDFPRHGPRCCPDTDSAMTQPVWTLFRYRAD